MVIRTRRLLGTFNENIDKLCISVDVVEKREQEGREQKKTKFLIPVLPTASSENLNNDLSFLISVKTG